MSDVRVISMVDFMRARLEDERQYKLDCEADDYDELSHAADCAVWHARRTLDDLLGDRVLVCLGELP